MFAPVEARVDSRTVVKALHQVDPGFVSLCQTLFGPAVDPSDAWAFMYDRDSVSKMSPGSMDLSTPTGLTKPNRGVLVPKPPTTQMPPKAMPTKPAPVAPSQAPVKKPTSPPMVSKAEDDEYSFPVVWSGEFSKMDTDRRQAFGWASVVEIKGEPVIDLQGDWISPDEIEKAAYAYVQKSRVGGTQHKRDEDGSPVKAGEMIESFVVTPEKIQKMGLPEDFPVGWWVGFQYDDDDTWADIKAGRKTGFSVHGRGKRVPAEI